jgi:hypothetical protein
LEPEVWTAFGTVLLVVVTALLAFIAYLQIKTTQRQLRAYVGVSSAKILVRSKEAGMPEALVMIHNSGETPARNVINVSGFAVGPYPVKEPLNLIISDQELGSTWTRMDLGSHGTSASLVPISSDPAYATPEAKAQFVTMLSEGKLIAFVYGEIRYRDVFGKRRWTKYRLMAGGPVGYRDGRLVGCQEGNEAT